MSSPLCCDRKNGNTEAKYAAGSFRSFHRRLFPGLSILRSICTFWEKDGKKPIRKFKQNIHLRKLRLFYVKPKYNSVVRVFGTVFSPCSFCIAPTIERPSPKRPLRANVTCRRGKSLSIFYPYHRCLYDFRCCIRKSVCCLRSGFALYRLL